MAVNALKCSMKKGVLKIFFPVNFGKFLRRTFFTEHLRMTTSVFDDIMLLVYLSNLGKN